MLKVLKVEADIDGVAVPFVDAVYFFFASQSSYNATREVSENILSFVVAHGFPASGWFPSTRGRGAAVANLLTELPEGFTCGRR